MLSLVVAARLVHGPGPRTREALLCAAPHHTALSSSSSRNFITSANWRSTDASTCGPVDGPGWYIIYNLI